MDENDDDRVSLRDYFAALRDADTDHSRERLGWLGAVGIIIWFEIQRRLEILNHENDRLLEQQRNSVSSDTYRANEQQRDAEQTELADWRKVVDADRTQSVTRDEFTRDNREQRQGIFQNRATLLALTASFVLVVIALLTYIATHHSTVQFQPNTTTNIVP